MLGGKAIHYFVACFYVFQLILSGPMELSAQELHPANYFVPPLKGKLKVVGTFGELRPNHFHSGIDFSTGGRIGLPVYACADGYVRRVRVSPYGYGKALYIKHSNGYETVYGHLSSFRTDLDSLLNLRQSENKAYELQEFPVPGSFKVKKGEIIGYSGNTGRSYGPHLHFEIRLSHKDRPINPELFALGIEDFQAPTISSLYQIENQDCSHVGRSRSIPLRTIGKNQWSTSNLSSIILEQTDYYFSLQCYDKQLSTSNRNGIYEIRLFAISKEDTSLMYHMRMDELDFSSGKCVNSTMDWDLKQAGKGTSYSLRKQEGNIAPIFPAIRKKEINPDSTIKYFLEVLDASGNKSSLIIDGSFPKKTINSDADCRGIHIEQGKDRSVTCNNYQLNFKANTLFQDLWLECSPSTKNGFESLSFKNRFLPLAAPIEITIPLDSNLRSYQSKLLLIQKYGSSQRSSPVEIGEDTIKASVSFLGDIWLEIDSIPPRVAYRRTDYTEGRKYLAYYVNDKGAGIKSYNAQLGDVWILSEYKSIQEEVRIYLPKELNETSLVSLEVIDELNNTSRISKTVKAY